jgi:hypothetical protein
VCFMTSTFGSILVIEVDLAFLLTVLPQDLGILALHPTPPLIDLSICEYPRREWDTPYPAIKKIVHPSDKKVSASAKFSVVPKTGKYASSSEWSPEVVDMKVSISTVISKRYVCNPCMYEQPFGDTMLHNL